jgi:hypothetical protein
VLELERELAGVPEAAAPELAVPVAG